MTRAQRFEWSFWQLALVPLTGCSYNKFVGQEEAIKAQWAQVREPAAAPERSDPQSRRDGEGLRASTKRASTRTSPTRDRGCSRRSRPKKPSRPPTSRPSALGRLLAVVENYPQLKANEQFNRLMDELSGTENRIAVERMRYNEAVQEYNTSRRQFPPTSRRRCSASRNTRSSRRRLRRSRCRK